MEEEKNNLQLDAGLLQSLQIARIHKDFKSEINSIDFSNDGLRLLACDKSSLSIYDCRTGLKIKTLYNKIHKISFAKFTHSNEAIICVNEIDNKYKISYWSIHENEIIKQFDGHHQAILSLEIHPQNDKFMSTGLDNSLKLWDLTSDNQQPNSVLDLNELNERMPISTYDTPGQIFALSSFDLKGQQSKIRLFDCNESEKGQFNTFLVDALEIRITKFSPNANLLLVGTSDNVIMILDSFKGTILNRLAGSISDSFINIEASFTPDSNFIIQGSKDGKIFIYDIKPNQSEQEQNKIIQILDGHSKASQCVKFSPLFSLMVSADDSLVFWLPNLKDKNLVYA